MPKAVPELRLSGGRLALAWPDGTAGLHDLRAVCRVLGRSGPEEHVGGAWRREEGAFRSRCGPLTVTISAEPERGLARLRFRATAGDALRCRDIGLRASVELRGATPAWLAYGGYQSWDAAGTAPLGGEQRKVSSWWTCALADDAGQGLAMAAQTASTHLTRFDVAAGGVLEWLHAAPPGGVGEAWAADPSSAFESEPLLLSAGKDVRVEATRVARRAGRRGRPPQGWLSWYHHGPWVSVEDVLANSEAVAGGIVPGLEGAVIQLDDGWQMAYGDWRPNTKFPDLAGMCSAIKARGQTPGIWTAPFLVSASSDLDSGAPEGWFVRDEKTGARLVDERHTVFGPMHVLDARVPAVRGHLERVFTELRGHGFEYFKIDFLYAGAGIGLDGFRAGLRAIRRGAGRDAYLLACGAPLLPVAGLVDGCRIGPDTCTPLYDPELGRPRPTVFGDEIAHVARNIAACGQLREWFHVDADVALAGGNLSEAQARQLITAVALSGGLYFLSDDLAQLAPDRLALLANPELPGLVAGGPATPDWEPEARGSPPATWRRKDGVIAVFNWSARPLHRRLPIQADGARDVWSGDDVPAGDGILELTVEPGDVRLVRVTSH